MKKLLIGILFLSCLLLFSSSQVFNCGTSGITIGSIMRSKIDEAMKNHPTVTILLAGTNDMINSKALSSYEDYEQNMRNAVKKIKESGSEIVLVTLPPCIESLLFQRHSREAFDKKPPNERIARANEIIRKIAAENKASLIDLHKIIMKHAPLESEQSLLRNPVNVKSPDGVHLTPFGAQILAEQIYEMIKMKQFKADRVVCLGDSNTFGAGLKKEEAYPAVLQDLLNKKRSK